MNLLTISAIRDAAALLLCAGFLASAALAQPSTHEDPGPVTTWSPTDAIARMNQLGIDSASVPIPVYFSKSRYARAAELGSLTLAAIEFYDATLGIRPPVTLAVLDENDWPMVTPVPYGFPHPFQGTPNVIFVGATAENEAVLDLRSRSGHASSESREMVTQAGLTWHEASSRLLDLVVFHELGHIYAGALEIETHENWFSEMLATYIGYAFLRSERPDLALVWDGVISSVLDSPRPAYTTIADFERLYVNVGIPNYQWYQGVFQDRVAEVYDAHGIGFIHLVREALPAGAEEALTTATLLERLEGLQPGFYAWAERHGLHHND